MHVPKPEKRAILTLTKKIQKKDVGLPVAAEPIQQKIKFERKDLGAWWPKASSPPPIWAIPHPVTGSAHFCMLSLMQGPGAIFEPGPVFLLYGAHWTRHNGYGYVHILAGHGTDLGIKKSDNLLGYPTLSIVARFVADILIHGSKIICEFSELKGEFRPVVVRSSKGSLILLPKFSSDGDRYYSVVTAIPGANIRGVEIGRIQTR